MPIQQMSASHPDVHDSTNDALLRCIEACYSCAQPCTACADACLATGSLATRRTGAEETLLRQMIETCAEACRLCSEECQRHAAQHELCRICAGACQSCEQACRNAASSIPPKLQ